MNASTSISRWVDNFIRQPAWWPLLILFWALVALTSYFWHIHDLEGYAHQMATLRGRLVFEIVETTRLWAAQHGGVYAPITAATPPNEYLETQEKVITTPAGKVLTKINPAYMTRQLGELVAKERDMRIHITSLKPINPNNKPDGWEAAALAGFERDRKETVSIVGAGETAVFRYMAPLDVKVPCMACHEKQGYRVGDIRGGISVTFPARYVFGIIDAQKRDYRLIHLAAFTLFAALAWASLNALRRNALALESARDELAETEKMASLGRMVAGFAHEVNTPVGVAVGAASQSRELVAELEGLLSKEEVTESELRERLSLLDDTSQLALANLKRTADMVQSFKRTAVDQASEAERDYDMQELVSDVLKGFHNAVKTTPITIDTNVPPNLYLYGPAGMLEQLLTNLLQNSRMHAFADGTRAGRINLQISADDNTVHIHYADDGAGMDAATLAHAFEPFNTTRRGTGGSGLGLYISYNLVSHGLRGTIALHSELGKGTRFDIKFPRRDSSA
jgi:two-component system NtrC family sensor kinase